MSLEFTKGYVKECQSNKDHVAVILALVSLPFLSDDSSS